MRNERKKSGVWPWIAGEMLITPVVYVLSIGPVIWLASRIPVPQSMAGIIGSYIYPFLWLASHSGTIGDYLIKYSEWWIQK